MQLKHIPLAQIHPSPRNAKKHPDWQIKKIAESIKQFGWIQPVVVTKDGEIVVGHGRYYAALALGTTELPVVYVENLSDPEIKALRIADNKIAETGWDEEALLAELEEIANLEDAGELPEGLYLEMTGFDREWIEDHHEGDGESGTGSRSAASDRYAEKGVFNFGCYLEAQTMERLKKVIEDKGFERNDEVILDYLSYAETDRD